MIRTSEIKKNIKISDPTHKAVKMFVARHGGTIESYVEEAIVRKLESDANTNDQAAGLRKLVNQ